MCFVCRGYVFFFGELDVGRKGVGREWKPFEPSLSQLRNIAFGSKPRRIRLGLSKLSRLDMNSLVPTLYLPSDLVLRVPRLAGITQIIASRVSSDPLTAQLAFNGWLRVRTIPGEARGADRDRNIMVEYLGMLQSCLRAHSNEEVLLSEADLIE